MNRLWSIFACFLFAACAGESPTFKVSSRDSAGIQIIESSGRRWEEGNGWVVADTPLLDLATSGTGPQHEFFRVRDALRFGDGGVVVADHGSNEIRFFSSSGEFIRSVGRQGEGPGEFQRIESLSEYRGDSIAVYDYWLSRVTLLGPEGEVGRIIPLRGLADRVRRLRVLGDSGFVGISYSIAPRSAEAGRYRTSYAVVRVSVEGSLIDTVAVLPGLESYRYAGGDVLPPFGKDGHLAVRSSNVILGSADQLEFDRYGVDQALRARVRVPNLNLRLSAEELELARRALSPEGLPPQLREAVGTVELPEFRPAYSNLLLDAVGCVWAAEYKPRGAPEGPTDWEVFSPEGEWLGGVGIPPRFTVFEVGVDYILGVRLDDLDVEHVQVLELDRR